jgi:hypothetical protein
MHELDGIPINIMQTIFNDELLCDDERCLTDLAWSASFTSLP